jgi:uncharacterized protein involved in exopolysaccharide biosynthesis
MATSDPATYEEALEVIRELEEQIESLDAVLLLRERAAKDGGRRHGIEDVATELGASDLLRR